MANVDDRFNKIMDNLQKKREKEQQIQERYNTIINNVNTRKDNNIQNNVQTTSASQRLTDKFINAINASFNNTNKANQPMQRSGISLNDASKINAISKENQGINQSKLQFNSSKYSPKVDLKPLSSGLVENVAKRFNVSNEEAQKMVNKSKEDDEKISFANLSKKVEQSSWGDTYPGKAVRGTLDVINNMPTYIDSAIKGADNGGASLVSYVNKVNQKKNETLDSMGTFGKIIAVANGDTDYLFRSKENKKNESKEIDNFLKSFKENNEKAIAYNQRVVDNTSTTKISSKLNELSPSIGNNAVGAGISAINPVAGTAYFIGSSAGSYYDDAIKRGMNENQALTYGAVMGTMEGITEKVALSETMKAGLLLGKGYIKKALMNTGISIGENFIQEAIMEPIQEVSAYVIGGKDKADFSNMGNRMLKSGIDGALSAILMEGATAGVSSAQNVQLKIENNENVSIEEIQQAFKDIQDSGKVDVKGITRQEIQYQVQKASREYAEKNNIQNLQQNSIKNQNNNQQQQITQAENKNGLNQNVEGQSETKFSKILNNQKLPMQSYIYEKSDNGKIDSLRQQATKYFNNSQEAHNFVDMLEKIIADKDVTINFDTNLGEDVNGSYYNGVITINPNSTRAGEFLAVHELTHAIGTDSMIKMVENYRKSNAEFDSQVQKLLKKYNQSEINEEALADIAGQLFGNQEYINNLATTNPSMFKRIYNEIKYLWHQFRGYKNQDQFVDDLMFKWEQAYRSSNKLNNTSRKSFAGENGLKSIYLADGNQSKLEPFKKAKEMEKSGKSTDEIFKETGWYKGNEGKWRFELDDSNWNIKDIKNYNKEGTFKLKDILDAPKLYEAYPELKDLKVHFDSKMKSSEYGALEINLNTGEQTINLNPKKIKDTDAKSYEMLGIKNQPELFSTLQHEIQHWIQKKEGFSTGSNPQYWFDVVNEEYQNRFLNLFGDRLELSKKYGIEKGDNIRYELRKYLSNQLRILNLQEAISENQARLKKIKKADMKVEYQESIDRSEKFVAETKQWLKEGKDKLEKYVGKDGLEMIDNAYNEYAEILNKRNKLGYDLYRNTAGEQEARDVESRIKLTSKEKKNTLPFIKDENTVYATDATDSYHVSEDFSNEIDKALQNKLPSNTQVKARDFTPDILVKNGVPDLPMLITQRHIKSIIYTLEEAQKLNLETKGINYHGLGKDLLIKAIDNMDSPKAIYKTGENNFLIITELKDKSNNEIVVPIQINGKGLYNDIFIDENQIKSVYGRNNLDNYLKKNSFEEIYKKEESDFNEGIQYPNIADSSSNNSIAPSNENVNTTKYSMQESENNSGSFNLPQKQIQGLENYSRDEIKDITKNYIQEKLQENGLDDINIIDSEIHGSRNRGNAKANSDLDIVVEYDGDIREDDFFDLLNEEPLYIDNVKVDINPITASKTGTLQEYMENSNKYDQEVLDKDKSLNLPKIDNKGNVLSQQQQEYFMDSKVRDENGKLLEVYHGTEANAGIPQEHWFTIFDLDHARPSTLGDGFYFTEDYERASSYAHSKGNVYKVYLNITNPFIKADNQTFSEAIREINPNYDIRKLYRNEHEASRFDGVKLRKYLIDNGYDGISLQGTYVAFYPEQIKNVNNQNPTSNPDIRYSKNSNTWQEYLEKEFPAKGTRTNMQDIKQGTNLPIGKNAKETTNNADINLPPKVSANNQYKDTTTKVRKHYKSIMESQYTSDEARTISKELMGSDTYVPETNKNQLEKADERISQAGPDSELNSLMARSTVGDKITSVDIAVGERLIQYYSKTGDKAKLRDAIQATAMAGTTAGQTVQAMSLLNHQTPEGQAVWLQRSVEKMNNDLKKQRGAKAEQIKLTDDMLNKIVNSETTEELHKNLDEVYKELGQQVTKTTIQKIDAWRYFSMLANPRTHIRNILGNTAMAKVQTAKNKVAGVTEAVVSKFNKNMERQHTIVPASKEVKAFAKADIKNVTDRLGLTENKYNPKSRIENNMRTFKHKALENTIGKAFAFNDYALEAEDGWGLKAGYKKALAEYMTANKLKPSTITDAQLAKARNYAVQQAKEATFHQDCQLATLVNQLANKNKFAKYTVDAILPFKKTPMNIAKAGIEYSPMGLAKSMVYDTVQLRKGNINVNQYIDNISKGVTGTGIALIGYALASMGIIKASGGDDDKEKYEQNQGKQTYSIRIGDNTYSLDWLAPTAIPFFIGAEIYELAQNSSEKKSSNSTDENTDYNKIIKSATNVLDAFTNSMNPMMEMSMLSGLTSALKSYEQGSSQMIASMGTNAVQSYVNQFFPTAMGQIAKTTDEYERSTTSTKSGVLPKAVDSTKNQIMAKIPGLRQMLPTKTDIWGNEMKQSDNVAVRAVENAIFPWARKSVSTSNVDEELIKLYSLEGNNSVIPDSSFSKDLTFSGQKYRMTSEEYSQYRKTYGDKSYKLINELIKSSEYKKLNNTQKQKAVEKIYEYAKECCKNEYAKNNDIDYEQSKMFKTVQKIEKSKGNEASYFDFLARTTDMKDKQKINVLVNSKYNKSDKSIIYENTLGSDDSLYKTIKSTNIDINEYLKYKTQEFTSDKVDDGTEKGKSVSGSKKTKVYDYVNKMNITGKQRLVLLGTQYKLTDSERAILANYIKDLGITKNEKLDMYKKLQGFTVYKDGRVTY